MHTAYLKWTCSAAEQRRYGNFNWTIEGYFQRLPQVRSFCCYCWVHTHTFSADLAQVAAKLDSLKKWTVTTYKTTKHSVFEQLGKVGFETVPLLRKPITSGGQDRRQRTGHEDRRSARTPQTL